MIETLSFLVNFAKVIGDLYKYYLVGKLNYYRIRNIGLYLIEARPPPAPSRYLCRFPFHLKNNIKVSNCDKTVNWKFYVSVSTLQSEKINELSNFCWENSTPCYIIRTGAPYFPMYIILKIARFRPHREISSPEKNDTTQLSKA